MKVAGMSEQESIGRCLYCGLDEESCSCDQEQRAIRYPEDDEALAEMEKRLDSSMAGDAPRWELHHRADAFGYEATLFRSDFTTNVALIYHEDTAHRIVEALNAPVPVVSDAPRYAIRRGFDDDGSFTVFYIESSNSEYICESTNEDRAKQVVAALNAPDPVAEAAREFAEHATTCEWGCNEGWCGTGWNLRQVYRRASTQSTDSTTTEAG